VHDADGIDDPDDQADGDADGPTEEDVASRTKDAEDVGTK